LFKAFGKLEDSNNAKLNSEGIGLGLMICHALVTQNGGTIEVHSEGPNKGCTFEFDFLLKPCEESQEDSEAHSVFMSSLGESSDKIEAEAAQPGQQSGTELRDQSKLSGDSPLNPTQHDFFSEDLDASRLDQRLSMMNLE